MINRTAVGRRGGALTNLTAVSYLKQATHTAQPIVTVRKTGPVLPNFPSFWRGKPTFVGPLAAKMGDWRRCSEMWLHPWAFLPPPSSAQTRREEVPSGTGGTRYRQRALET